MEKDTEGNKNFNHQPKDELDEIVREDGSTISSKFSELSVEEKKIVIQEIQEKLKNNPSPSFSNYRTCYLDELKSSIGSLKYDFNYRFNMCLNYIKSKKGDKNCIVFKNNLLNMNYKDNGIEADDTKDYDRDEKTIQSPSIEVFQSLLECKEFEANEINQVENLSISLIVDLSNYIDKSDYRFGSLNKELLSLQLSKLKNLGVLIILSDIATTVSLEDYFKNTFEQNPTINYLIKSITIAKSPLISIISFQKFEVKAKVDFTKFKIHLAELVTFPSSEPKISKISDLSFAEYTRAHSYQYQLEQVSALMKKV